MLLVLITFSGGNIMPGEENEKSPFSKLAQIGIIVKDMDTTIEKLTAFGIGPFEHRSVPPGAKEWYKNKPMDATFKIAAVNVGGVELEFIQPVDGDSPHKNLFFFRSIVIDESLVKIIDDIRSPPVQVR